MHYTVQFWILVKSHPFLLCSYPALPPVLIYTFCALPTVKTSVLVYTLPTLSTLRTPVLVYTLAALPTLRTPVLIYKLLALLTMRTLLLVHTLPDLPTAIADCYSNCVGNLVSNKGNWDCCANICDDTSAICWVIRASCSLNCVDICVDICDYAEKLIFISIIFDKH